MARKQHPTPANNEGVPCRSGAGAQSRICTKSQASSCWAQQLGEGAPGQASTAPFFEPQGLMERTLLYPPPPASPTPYLHQLPRQDPQVNPPWAKVRCSWLLDTWFPPNRLSAPSCPGTHLIFLTHVLLAA